MENIFVGYIRKIDSFLLILLSWGPPGQEVNSFQCEKLATVGDGETEPDRSASFLRTPNAALSEYSQCGSGTSIYTDLYPFQGNSDMYMLFP